MKFKEASLAAVLAAASAALVACDQRDCRDVNGNRAPCGPRGGGIYVSHGGGAGGAQESTVSRGGFGGTGEGFGGFGGGE